jgi:hypothetical protein
MIRVPLNEDATVKLDGSGNGTVKLGPASSKERWYPQVTSVRVSTATNEAVAKIYAGDAVKDQNFVDGTFSGSSGDASDRVSGQEITYGNWIWAAWTSGDINAVATLVVYGEKEIPG